MEQKRFRITYFFTYTARAISLLLVLIVLCSVIPYVNAKQGKLLPVSVVENAAGLLGPATHQFLPLTLPTDAQCQYLNELCAGAGLDFTFDMTTSLVDINAVCVITKPTPFVRGLPSHDPFSHAQFIDEGVLGDMSSAAPVQSAGTSVAPLGGGVDARSVGPLTPVSQPAVSTLPPSQVSIVSLIATLPHYGII